MTHRWSEEDLKRVKKEKTRAGDNPGQELACASSGVSAAPSYKSKLEAAFANRLILEHRAGNIDGWLYEPFTFRLSQKPEKRYRVDFIAWGSVDGKPFVTCYEVKGWHKNYRDSLTHLAWACQRFPFFQWRKVVSNGKRGFTILDVL